MVVNRISPDNYRLLPLKRTAAYEGAAVLFYVRGVSPVCQENRPPDNPDNPFKNTLGKFEVRVMN